MLAPQSTNADQPALTEDVDSCVLPVARRLAKVILERIRLHLENLIDRKEANFRSASFCTGSINTFRIIMQQCTELRSPLYLPFIEFCIWRSLHKNGISGKLIAIIRGTYGDVDCHMLQQGEISGEFKVKRWVRRGCIFSPIPFILLTDDVIPTALAAGLDRVQWAISSLYYADDIYY